MFATDRGRLEAKCFNIGGQCAVFPGAIRRQGAGRRVTGNGGGEHVRVRDGKDGLSQRGLRAEEVSEGGRGDARCGIWIEWWGRYQREKEQGETAGVHGAHGWRAWPQETIRAQARATLALEHTARVSRPLVWFSALGAPAEKVLVLRESLSLTRLHDRPRPHHGHTRSLSSDGDKSADFVFRPKPAQSPAAE